VNFTSTPISLRQVPSSRSSPRLLDEGHKHLRNSVTMKTSQSRAFEFVYGNWTVHNQKLRNVADPTCGEWVEFDATSEVVPILDGIGRIDRMHVPRPLDGDPFEGFTLRLFDPSTQTWSIWWSSTRALGRLEPPVVGQFAGDHGTFECDDVVGGREVTVRFEWLADAVAPIWRQSFSYDHGQSWKMNWEMKFVRSSAVVR
jgi:hypothetical protein